MQKINYTFKKNAIVNNHERKKQKMKNVRKKNVYVFNIKNIMAKN